MRPSSRLRRFAEWGRGFTWSKVSEIFGGALLTAVGSMVLVARETVLALPWDMRFLLAVSLTLIFVPFYMLLTQWVIRWWERRKRPSIQLWPAVDKRNVLLTVHSRATDDFKATTRLFPRTPRHQPVSLRWHETEGEYRTIFGTASEQVHLLEYRIREPGVGLPPEVDVTVPSSVTASQEYRIRISDYMRLQDGKLAEAKQVFRVGIVGRQTAGQVFEVLVRFRWFADETPFEFEVWSEVLTPRPSTSFPKPISFARVPRGWLP